jgi:putative ABC transport system substrate-binding protein
MRRRDLLRLLATSVAGVPVAAAAQQTKTRIVGFLSAGTMEQGASYLAAWRDALAEGGFVEGRNLAVEYRWTGSDQSLFPSHAADLTDQRNPFIPVLQTESRP